LASVGHRNWASSTWLSSVGLADLLEPFRNASYGLMLDVEVVGGRRRVVGLMPEARPMAAICIGAAASLGFLRHVLRMRCAAASRRRLSLALS